MKKEQNEKRKMEQEQERIECRAIGILNAFALVCATIDLDKGSG